MLREIPSLAWKSSKRVTSRKAPLTMSRLHHSPTMSRHWATEQVMSSKLVRCTNPSIEGCVIERTSPLGWIPGVQHCQVQPAEPLRVGHHVDVGDLAVGHREPEHHPQSPAR